MNEVAGGLVSIALIHYPVYDKNRQVVTTAVTNFDLHDLARAARTYGVARYYVVTPVPEQQVLAERIIKHWQDGWGAQYNSKRKNALDIVEIVSTLDEAVQKIAAEHGQLPDIIVTGAKENEGSISFSDLRSTIKKGDRRYLILFGTGWGLTEEVFDRASYRLEPIKGNGSYNHLSVRAAAAIILDRLLGHH